ncbi:hypothetical protein Vadar_027512 [Vaccinium darrowii]|uniref:Uncharacterized protein n=1 Tax=Vaccinium darrowii TaxID=229202 RepID=A0ACB7X4C2_9ERIC|nr:hypothetical protein Vadar_027512 [Vaccinium darrowii]
MHLHVLLFLLSWLLLAAQPTRATNTTANIAAVTDSSFFVSMPGCPLKCGNVTVPYPFGIGSSCSIDPRFNITCNTSSNPPKLYIGDKYNTFEVLNISQTQVWTPILFIYQCYNRMGGLTTYNGFPVNLDYISFPYSISHTANKVTAVGCNDFAVMGTSDTRGFLGEIGGCLPSCWGTVNITTNCNGFGCCQSDIPKGQQVVGLDIVTVGNHSEGILIVLVVIITLVMEKQTELGVLHNSQHSTYLYF